LQSIPAGDVEIDLCPRCQGLWFDAGELELFPERPSVKAFLTQARGASGRCRRNGHRVPRGMVRCPSCSSDAAKCPCCGGALAMVATPTCVIDLCINCQGVWLDKGELEQLAGVKARPRPGGTKAPPPLPPGTTKVGDWEVPAPAVMADDHWLAPGHRSALPRVSDAIRAPLACRHCGDGLEVRSAYAFDGDIYCASCRPDGAVSGAVLPRDLDWKDESAQINRHWGKHGLDFGAELVHLIVNLAGTLLRR
jgi:Zn-finger nucleic acid-binding protein